MRLLPALLLVLFAPPAFAQAWSTYENARFGFSIDVPANFVRVGEADNGDGLELVADGRPVSLLAWGGNLPGTFNAEVEQRMRWDQDDAWNLTNQTITPRWATWSAIKGFRIRHQRMVLLCDGTRYAAFRAEYSVTDSSDMDPMIERMARSLRGAGC